MPKLIKVTWSGLARWQKCSYSQKLVMEGKSKKAMDGRVFLLGNLCDHTMRKWLEVGDFSVPMEYYLRDVWESNTGIGAERPIKWKNRADQEDVVEKAKDGLAKLEVVLREEVIPYRYEPEMRFTSTLGVPTTSGEVVHVEMFGAVDVAVMYPDDSIGIFDLKMSKDRSYITKSLGQLTLYDLAIRNYLGVKPSRHGFFAPMLKGENLILADIADEDRRKLASDIVTYCQSIWNDEWALTEDENNCYGCQVRHACPRWVKPINLEQQKKNLERFGLR